MPNYESWVMKCKIDMNELKFTCEDPELYSTLFLHELVWSVCEYTANKMLVQIHPTDFLVVHDWNVVKRVLESEKGNIEKYW